MKGAGQWTKFPAVNPNQQIKGQAMGQEMRKINGLERSYIAWTRELDQRRERHEKHPEGGHSGGKHEVHRGVVS